MIFLRDRFDKIFNKPQKVNYCDVNSNVIKRFDECDKLNEDFLKIFREYFEPDFELDNLERDFNKEDCIESLGIFIFSDIDEYVKGNIFLAPYRIKKTANKFNLIFSSLYDFIRIHEKAHSIMSPEIIFEEERRYISKDFYLFFEEMLATLYALSAFKRHPEIEKIRNFVSNQPVQYKAALLFNEKKVEPMVITWLLFKADRLPDTKNDLYYEYVDLEFRDKLIKMDGDYLLKEIEDLLSKGYVKPSEVQRKLNIGYNKAALVLEKLYEYGKLKINKREEFVKSI